MGRAALWPWACALALCLRPALAQVVATNLPPEDQDGSGDDSDTFSGSGAGALQDIAASPQAPATGKDTWLLSVMPTVPEPGGREATASSTPVLPAGERQEEGEAAVPMGARPDLTAREEGGEPKPREPTQLPGTQRAQAPTSPHAPRDVHPGLAEGTAPAASGQPDGLAPSAEGAGPSATESTEDGAPSQLPAGEGSGEQDFTFDSSGENVAVAAVDLDDRSEPPVGQGASQGLLGRKEVLGGVIAGGVVGLVFAVCLVGFMLYRMKKKDEGSYSLEEPKQANGGAYQKPTKQEEFYA
ncbi:syndecan-1 [Heterocephalus glaber]|uniref:Syndecan n=1 Tax=Heterocephalus glaber TaxID=10181 RepID=A0AAX6NXH1_HETGA|nr:syndecan-1 [Heterocephalus glaber]